MTPNLIPVENAEVMTALCRAQKENILATSKQGQGIIPTCETFSRDAFDLLLDISECTGVRIYSAMDNDLKIRFVICGVNSANEDVFIPVTPSLGGEPVPSVIENGIRCPNECPPDSPLNN